MRLKHYFLISCLFGAVLTLNAQSDTRSLAYWGDPVVWNMFVDCDGDGTPDDWVQGEIKHHQIFHIKDGKPDWKIDQVRGEAISVVTGEIFKYRELNKLDITNMVRTVKFVLQGNDGTKYIGTYTLVFDPFQFTVNHLICK